MIPRQRPQAEKAVPEPVEPIKLVEIEVEEVEIQMRDGVKLAFVLKEGDTCEVDKDTTAIVVHLKTNDETVRINELHICWLSRRRVIRKVPEQPYVPPIAAEGSTGR